MPIVEEVEAETTVTDTALENEATEEEEAEAEEYTYTELDEVMYAKSSVNVRDMPTADGVRKGGLATNQEVHVTGQCNETGWYRIDYDDGLAYVSNKYLSADMAAVEETSSSETASSTKEPCPYQLNVWTQSGSEASTVFIAYGPYSTNYRSFVDATWNGEIANNPFETNVFVHFSAMNNCGFHTCFAPVEYVGDYAEGKIYKCTWGAHFTQGGACPDHPNCTAYPGTLTQ